MSKKISERIAELLQNKNGGNQSELARYVGVSPQAVQQWISGTSSPRGKNLQRAAEFFGITEAELQFGEQTKPREYVIVPGFWERFEELPYQNDNLLVAEKYLDRWMKNEICLEVSEVLFLRSIAETNHEGVVYLITGTRGPDDLRNTSGMSEQKLLQFLKTEIMKLDGVQNGSSNSTIPLRPIKFNVPVEKRLVVRGVATAGSDKNFIEAQYQEGGIGTLDFYSSDAEAYALRIEGDSMMPRIKHGEYVVIEPSKQISPGDEVFVTTKGGQNLLKEYVYARDGRVRLESINQDHPSITIDESEIVAMFYVSAIVKSSRFIEKNSVDAPKTNGLVW